jgi:hypothetical protein
MNSQWLLREMDLCDNMVEPVYVVFAASALLKGRGVSLIGHGSSPYAPALSTGSPANQER